MVVFQKRYRWEDVRLAETLVRSGTKVCFDLCDHHEYALRLREDVDRLNALTTMQDLADIVTVPTPTLAELVRASRVSVVNDAVEPAPSARLLGSVVRDLRRSRLRIVWFGSAGMTLPRHGIPDIASSIPPLETVASHTPIELLVISNDRALYDELVSTSAFPHEYREWSSPATAHRAIAASDLCLLPTSPNPFTAGKSANRAVLALLLGTPVVATPHPSYAGMEHLVRQSDRIDRAVEDQIRSRNGRRRMKRTHADDALSEYSPPNVASRWKELLSTI